MRGGGWSKDTHNCTFIKPNHLHVFFFSIRALLLCFATDPKMAKCTESINVITNYPLRMWQSQFNTLSLLTVQKQIQYHCGHKVQDSENITKLLEAIAAMMEEK